MPIPLRPDVDASQVLAEARRSKDGPQARRLLSLAAIYDGASRTEAARIGGVTLQIVRDWVMKFNDHGPDRLIDRKAPGQPSRLNDTHRAALAAVIESGPTPSIHGVVRWRIVDLCQWLHDQFGVTIAEQTPDFAVVQHRGDDLAPGGNLRRSRAMSFCWLIKPGRTSAPTPWCRPTSQSSRCLRGVQI